MELIEEQNYKKLVEKAQNEYLDFRMKMLQSAPFDVWNNCMKITIVSLLLDVMESEVYLFENEEVLYMLKRTNFMEWFYEEFNEEMDNYTIGMDGFGISFDNIKSFLIIDIPKMIEYYQSQNYEEK